jgi:hypothetical protein
MEKKKKIGRGSCGLIKEKADRRDPRKFEKKQIDRIQKRPVS